MRLADYHYLPGSFLCSAFMITTPHGPVSIVYEDNHLLVISKPVGIPVQEDESGSEDLLTILKQWLKTEKNKPGNVYLALIHRLDRPVGGVMIFAKTSKAASRLNEQFRNHQVDKFYLAVLQKSPASAEGRLEHHLKKNRKTNIVTAHSKAGKNTREATLWYRIIDQKESGTLVAVLPETGRPHQIRVQFARIGCPLWGDHKYGGSTKGNPALFSSALRINHPTKKDSRWFTARPQAEPWHDFQTPDEDFWKDLLTDQFDKKTEI